ncbi:MAG: hypothetical protein AAGG75_24610 [Bacteroidota bacterium]
MQDDQQQTSSSPEAEQSYFWLYYLGLEILVFFLGIAVMNSSAGPDGPLNALGFGIILIGSRVFMNLFLIAMIIHGMVAKKEKLKSQAAILFIAQLILVLFIIGMMTSSY